jgi:ABC-type phosphate transport system substrate-binding protein
MRHLTSLVFFAAGLISAADIKVIANQSVKATQVSTDELKRIFLGTDTSLEGSNVFPVFERGGATHEAFLKQYLGKTDAALNTYYRSLVFTGKAFMPKILRSDAEVVAYVAKTKDAIGYVDAGASAPGAKEIAVR